MEWILSPCNRQLEKFEDTKVIIKSRKM